ncbi:STAS domain-containing protein [Actinoplanes campanulatus]|uniref:STAS domain-containing protein n=1 Tax=Actinoplanes campanulatus TaxID=113559 RepID=UPI001954CC3C|nr:STAS domain-containing protein [Actinoplanes capillaceus]
MDQQTPDDAEAVRLAAVGALARDTASLMQAAVVDVLRHHLSRRIDIDLAGVTFLDAGGIRTLLTCRADARQVGCRLTLSNPQPLVYRVLNVAGLLRPFGVTRSHVAVAAQPAHAGRAMQLADAAAPC